MQVDPSLDLEYTEDVYNPSDDSYMLLKVADVSTGESFLEMGCGTGLVALHAARLGAKVTASDVSPRAVDCARRNAARNHIRMDVVLSDLFANVKGTFDVIAFNPPYLPGTASSTSWIERSWSGGGKGSETSIEFLEQAWRHLAPGGRIYLILSSLTGLTHVLKSAKERYEVDLLDEKRMFFESLYAYKLRLKTINR